MSANQAGRPTKYKPEYDEQAAKLCALGATDQEIADFFEVNVATIYRWKAEHEGFCDAIKIAKAAADARVERSLFQRAIGYEQDEVKIFMPANAEAPVYAPFRAKIQPDTTAAIFWLKNRKPAEWRDKQETVLSGPDGGPVEMNVTLEPGEAYRRMLDAG